MPYAPMADPDAAATARQLDSDETLVDLRCSVVILRHDRILLLHRLADDQWVLPGGRPQPRESLASCARREVFEETGLRVAPGRCAFVLEVGSPDGEARIVELVFVVDPAPTDYALHEGEPGRVPTWVGLRDLASRSLRPPIAGHLRALARDRRATAGYLGNVWRPDAGADDAGAGLEGAAAPAGEGEVR